MAIYIFLLFKKSFTFTVKMCVGMFICMMVPMRLKRTQNSLMLELQAIVSHLMCLPETEFVFSARVSTALDAKPSFQ